MSLASTNKEEDSADFRAILPVLLQQSDKNINFKIRVLSALLPVILACALLLEEYEAIGKGHEFIPHFLSST
jgi:hypothetical protein